MKDIIELIEKEGYSIQKAEEQVIRGFSTFAAIRINEQKEDKNSHTYDMQSPLGKMTIVVTLDPTTEQ